MDMNTFLGIFGAVTGVLGLVAGYYFYRKSVSLKEPSWIIESNELIRITSRITDLEILYKNQKIESLVSSEILFWNNGGETIRNNDLTDINPLRIVPKGDAQILDVQVLRSSNSSNKFEAHLDDNHSCVLITFDYIDKYQGVSIQVIHTGRSSKSIELVGDIKGAPKINNVTEKRSILDVIKQLIQ